MDEGTARPQSETTTRSVDVSEQTPGTRRKLYRAPDFPLWREYGEESFPVLIPRLLHADPTDGDPEPRAQS